LVFSFGLTRPVHVGEYLWTDAVAVLLISMLKRLARVEMKRGAAMIRTHWHEWLIALSRAERQMDAAPIKQTYFAVGTDYDGKQIAAFGTPKEANATLEARGGPYASLYYMSLQRVIRTLRENAKQARLDWPEFLTPDPASAEFDKFLERIRNYQQRGRAKAKKKATA
jgi:hypothetical protein